MDWTAHIDTDEFLVVNPVLRPNPDSFKNNRVGHNTTTNIYVPTIPVAGSLHRLLLDVLRWYSAELESTSCFIVPTLLFGSKEDDVPLDSDIHPNNNITKRLGVWDTSRFETLRWRYHGNMADSRPTGSYPKAIVNVVRIPYDHPIFRDGLVSSIHRPLRKKDAVDGNPDLGCPVVGGNNKNNNNDFFVKQSPIESNAKSSADVSQRVVLLSRPLSTNHYLGSLDRYLSRKDARRSVTIYHNKARQVNGPWKDDDGWISQWLSEFVKEHGIDKVSRVLGDYILFKNKET
jgi:hypothetical protein